MQEEITQRVKSPSVGKAADSNGEVNPDEIREQATLHSAKTSIDTTVYAETAQKTKVWIDQASPFLSQLVEVAVFGAAALFALAAINEISARAQFGVLVDKQIADMQSEYVQIGEDNTPEGQHEKRQTKVAIFKARHIAHRLHNLEAMGTANFGNALYFLSLSFSGADSLTLAGFNEAGSLQIPGKEMIVKALNIPYLSSDYLLAIVIMACALIGSLIGGLRKKVYLTLRTVVLGLGTGFIVYLGNL